MKTVASFLFAVVAAVTAAFAAPTPTQYVRSGVADNVLQAPIVGSTTAPIYSAPIASIAALRALNVTTPALVNGAQIQVSGYYAANDGGGGTYVWNSASTAADNGGTVIQATGVTTGRWLLQYSGPINVRWFGAKGDGATDDRSSIQNAIDVASVGNGIVYIPANGAYLVNGTLTTPAFVAGQPRGVKILGDHIGTVLKFNTSGVGIEIYGGTSTSEASYSVEIANIRFATGASSPSTIIHNNGCQNTTIRRCWFVDGTATYGIRNTNSYGLTVTGCLFYGFTGTGILFEGNGALTNYSYQCVVRDTDMSAITGTCVEIQSCLSILFDHVVMEDASGKAIYAHPQDTTGQAWGITFVNCFFERNATLPNIDLQSTASYWCEASFINSVFNGTNTIALGANSRVRITGNASNAVTVSGTASAFALLYGATNFNQAGTFVWTAFDSDGQVVASTNVFAGVTSSVGDITNQRLIVGGVHYTAKGSVTPNSGVATTIFTPPAASGTSNLYLVSASLAAGSAGNTGSYIVAVQDTSTSVTQLKAAGSLSLSTSGLAIQATQTTGAPYTIEWTAIRLQ